jgi:hypothetical protein
MVDRPDSDSDMNRDWHMPLCRSAYLQDYSIELGRHFSRHRPFRFFRIQTESCERDGRELEGLSMLAGTSYDTGARLIVWEDQRFWVDVVLWPSRNNGEYLVGFHRACDGFTHGALIETFRETVNVSTRLCYRESPLPILRQIWKHSGNVEVYGDLNSK